MPEIVKFCDVVVLVDGGNTVLYEDVKKGIAAYQRQAGPPKGTTRRRVTPPPRENSPNAERPGPYDCQRVCPRTTASIAYPSMIELKDFTPRRLKIVIIALPMLLVTIYFTGFAANRYVSESTVALQQAGNDLSSVAWRSADARWV